MSNGAMEHLTPSEEPQEVQAVAAFRLPRRGAARALLRIGTQQVAEQGLRQSPIQSPDLTSGYFQKCTQHRPQRVAPT